MLVLTRKVEQKIQVGADITITILRVKGQSVRIGVEAPRNVRVLRAELPLHDDSLETTSEVAATTGDRVDSPERMVRGSIAPRSALVRDRSNAGASAPQPHPMSGRSTGKRGVSPTASLPRTPVIRMTSGLADRVAARRSTGVIS